MVAWLFPHDIDGTEQPFFETIESQKVPQSELQADELDRTYIRFYDGLLNQHSRLPLSLLPLT